MRNYDAEYVENGEFVRVGDVIDEGDIKINLWQAERLRDLGREVLLTENGSKAIDESQLQAAVLLRGSAMLPTARHNPDVPDIYVSVEDTSVGDDSWHTLIRYNSYRDCRGILGLESDYEVEVFGGEVVLAKRSLYHLRDAKQLEAEMRPDSHIKVVHKRSVLETPMTSDNIDKLAQKVRLVLAKKERFG